MHLGKGEDTVGDINARTAELYALSTLLCLALFCVSLFNSHHNSSLGAALTLPDS